MGTLSLRSTVTRSEERETAVRTLVRARPAPAPSEECVVLDRELANPCSCAARSEERALPVQVLVPMARWTPK
jgi:hypothetical protein